jgi:hypothetical protein
VKAHRGHGARRLTLAFAALVISLATPCLSPSLAGAYVYFASDDAGAATIGRANPDGSGAEGAFLAIPGVTVYGISSDAGHLFWAGGLIGSIGRSNIDGSGADASFIDVPAYDVETDGSHVYWSSEGQIGRANLDGSGVNADFITGAGSGFASSVAVDAKHVYWANLDFDTIGRANLDGSGVDQSFIEGAVNPEGIAVDSGHVYWNNYWVFEQSIGRANLDGTNVDQHFIEEAGYSRQLETFAEHLYWTDWDQSRIVRARLDGTHIKRDFISGFRRPFGLEIDDRGPVDRTAPNTKITQGMPDRTTKRRVTMKFRSTEPASSFECKLFDSRGEPWRRCTSPVRYYPGLGRHTFSVRSVDRSDNVDASPARDRFRIVTRRR